MIAMIFVLCTFLASSPLIAQDAPFAEGIPTQLNITYAHDMGSVGSVELKDGRLICNYGSINKKMFLVIPTLDQWTNFIHELNPAKVYKWASSYSSHPTALDGGFTWSIDFQVGGRSFHSTGVSAVPPDGDLTPEQRGNSKTKAFDLFCDAVSHLTGQGFPTNQY
jgi:hypothetical protein